jgi:hypothetical protein
LRRSHAFGSRRLPRLWELLSCRFWRDWLDWQEGIEWRVAAAEGKLRHVSGQVRMVEERLARLEVTVDGVTSAGPLGQLFRKGVGQEWTVFTGTGALSGQVLAVGDDYVCLREAVGDDVYLPYAQVVALSPPDERGGWQ